MDFFGGTIDDAKKAAQQVVESAMASFNGNVEQSTVPFVIKSLDGFIDRTILELDRFVDSQLAKIRKLRVTISVSIQ